MILANLPDWFSESGIALVSLVILVFIVNRLGLIAWFSWISRRTPSTQDSSAKKYWSAHE
jgi:predicted negative regulator of RcsB-dependent stress response